MKTQHEPDVTVRAVRAPRGESSQLRVKDKSKDIRTQTLRRLAEDRLRHFESLR